MSKHNNVNPNFYYEGDRNHQGEGILQEENKKEMNENRRNAHGDERQPNSIPGEAPVGEHSEKKGR